MLYENDQASDRALLARRYDYILWYAKKHEHAKVSAALS